MSPHLFTHLFYSGVIISTRKLVYDAGAAEDAVKGLMQAQHKVVMKDLRRGAFDDKIDQYLAGTPGLLPRGATEGAADASGPIAASAVRAVDAPPPPSGIDAPTLVDKDAAAIAAAVAEANATVPTPMPSYDSGREVQLEIVPASETSEVIHLTNPRPPSRDDSSPSDGVPGAIGATPSAGGPPDRGGQYAQHRSRSASDSAIPSGLGLPPSPRGSTQMPVAGHSAPVGARTPTPSSVPPRAPDAASRPAERPRTPTPARVSSSTAAQSRGPAGQGGVVMSRPAVIVGAPAKSAAPPRVRKAREDEGRGFGQGLISEKSLDEVILAYLSEDAEDT